MTNRRKKYAHPPLVPPRTIWDRQFVNGKWVKMKRIRVETNDDYRTINGRTYNYHPTKGWRSFKAA